MIQPAAGLNELDRLTEAAECLKTLAHPHRLRMIQLLMKNDYSVSELAEACQIASHAASEHLRLMKDRGMLRKERGGHCVYYRIAHERVAGVMQFVTDHFAAEAPTA